MIYKLVVPVEEGRYIVFSSLFFMGPCMYSFILKHYGMSFLLFLCSSISVNYWIYPIYGWRRNLDLLYAKFVFSVFFCNGVYYGRNPLYISIGYPCAGALGYCYYMSNALCNSTSDRAVLTIQNKKPWFAYHMMFHALMTLELFLILVCI